MNSLSHLLAHGLAFVILAATFALGEEAATAPAPSVFTIQGEVPEGWEVVADPSGAKVVQRVKLANGEEKEVFLPRLILRPIGKREPSPSEKTSIQFGKALEKQGEHLSNSQEDIQSVLRRVRLLLSQSPQPTFSKN